MTGKINPEYSVIAYYRFPINNTLKIFDTSLENNEYLIY